MCNNQLNVSIGPDCEGLITFDMVLEGEEDPAICSPNAPTDFLVTVMLTPNGPAIPTSPVVTSDYAGTSVYARVRHLPSNNFCTGILHIKDLDAPQITCPPNVTVTCKDAILPASTGEPTATDCASVTVSYTDMIQDFGCADPQRRILRSWLATDIFNNNRGCVQTITVAKATLSQVVFPPNYNGVAQPPLNCAAANTHPDATGRPSLGGFPLSLGDGCGFVVNYQDVNVPVCGGEYIIQRTWKVFDQCTSGLIQQTQIIRVEDKQGPQISCPAPMTVGTTSSTTCTAQVTLPAAMVSDACSAVTSVRVMTAFGNLDTNGGVLQGAPEGANLITYVATDACGNTSSCQTRITVEDRTAPTVVCDDLLFVSLNNTGTVQVFASSFDEGSGDNCCLDRLEVKRAGQPDGAYGPAVTLTCNDTGLPLIVIMRATDCSGNANTCATQVWVVDETPPAIACPPAAVIPCTEQYTNLFLTGQPAVTDNCSTATVTYSDAISLNSCGVGQVLRTWLARDAAGRSATCTQLINVVDNTIILVDFPDDYTLADCISPADLHPDSLPPAYRRPLIDGDDCEHLEISWEDLVFSATAGNTCFEIQRTWTVIETCVYEPGNPAGVYRHTQRIRVIDDEPPHFTCPQSFTVELPANACTANIQLPAVTEILDCSGEVDVIVGGALGMGYVHNGVPAGVYPVTYTLVDGCDNLASCSITVTVRDRLAPTANCLNGVSVSLDADRQATVPATAFIGPGTADNCTPSGQLQYRLGLQPTPGQTLPPATSALSFGCEDLGAQLLALWVGDASGNWNYCQTYLIVDDQEGYCTASAMIAGRIENELGQKAAQVTVKLNNDDQFNAQTNIDGVFSFSNMPTGTSYSIRPLKNTNAGNGVTTLDVILVQRHILTTQLLTSPYKIIAADVNRSGTVTVMDIIAMQRVILNLTDAFPGNTSWRFIRRDYIFPEPGNPFMTAFPETYEISQLTVNTLDADFVAVKVGDVNMSADMSGLAAPAEQRSAGEAFVLTTSDASFFAGQPVLLDFYALDDRTIGGFQFTLQYDPALLRFRRFIPGGKTGPGGWLLEPVGEGILAGSWAAQEARALTGTPLFHLEWEALGNGRVSSSLELSSGLTPAEAYHLQEGEWQTIGLGLAFGMQQVKEEWAVVFPNPIHDRLQVRCHLTRSAPVSMVIRDVSGRTLRQWRKSGNQGWNEWQLQGLESLPTGLLFIEIRSEELHQVRKFVKDR